MGRCSGGWGITSSFLLSMVGTMTIIKTFITPYLIKMGWKFADGGGNLQGRFNPPKEK
jgi:hypothetical protein